MPRCFGPARGTAPGRRFGARPAARPRVEGSGARAWPSRIPGCRGVGRPCACPRFNPGSGATSSGLPSRRSWPRSSPSPPSRRWRRWPGGTRPRGRPGAPGRAGQAAHRGDPRPGRLPGFAARARSARGGPADRRMARRGRAPGGRLGPGQRDRPRRHPACLRDPGRYAAARTAPPSTCPASSSRAAGITSSRRTRTSAGGGKPSMPGRTPPSSSSRPSTTSSCRGKLRPRPGVRDSRIRRPPGRSKPRLASLPGPRIADKFRRPAARLRDDG